MVNTYGRTACPQCGTLNSMFRPLDIVKLMPTWNRVVCWECLHEYKHTDKINNVKSEAETAKEEGRA